MSWVTTKMPIWGVDVFIFRFVFPGRQKQALSLSLFISQEKSNTILRDQTPSIAWACHLPSTALLARPHLRNATYKYFLKIQLIRDSQQRMSPWTLICTRSPMMEPKGYKGTRRKSEIVTSKWFVNTKKSPPANYLEWRSWSSFPWHVCSSIIRPQESLAWSVK